MSRVSRFEKLVCCACGEHSEGEVGNVPANEALEILTDALAVNFGADREAWFAWYETQHDKDAVDRRCANAWKKTFGSYPSSPFSSEEIIRLMKESEREAALKRKQKRQLPP
ncbi:MAG: hypothetical protein HUU03_12570 [Planctomycetaceae bacterium]|nr:hypothetical protein [Planctomycetaceae bacterium]GIK53826.1 MAG: hypothetical protein BroJett014_27990 [Planctomycetota bacterium]